MRAWRGLTLLPAFGAASLTLAHLLTATAFRTKTREIFARLENMAAAEVQAAPVPAIIQSFARRAVGRNPVPRVVWLRQIGEMRATPKAQWRPFTAEQVITVHKPGFAWLARMQAMPLLSAHVLDCYINGEGLLEARLWGSLPLARLAGHETSKGELMRYLAELIWAPHAMRHNPALSWREIGATIVEVSASSTGGAARVRLIFENGDVARIEADDRPRVVGHRIVPTRWQGCCADYREFEGCGIPTRVAVSWSFDDSPFEYWRGKVTAYGLR